MRNVEIKAIEKTNKSLAENIKLGNKIFGEFNSTFLKSIKLSKKYNEIIDNKIEASKTKLEKGHFKSLKKCFDSVDTIMCTSNSIMVNLLKKSTGNSAKREKYTKKFIEEYGNYKKCAKNYKNYCNTIEKIIEKYETVFSTMTK